MNKEGKTFVIGRDLGFAGRWFRLIVGLYFSALNAWQVRQDEDEPARQQARRLMLGAGVLLIFMAMFVAGKDAMRLFEPALALGSLFALGRWLRRRLRPTAGKLEPTN